MFDNPAGFINFVAIRRYPEKVDYNAESNIKLHCGTACPGESFAGVKLTDNENSYY